MRRALIFLGLILVACTDKSSDTLTVSHPVYHRPHITEIAFSPNSAEYMAGGGSIEVTASLVFWDAGGDVEQLWLQTPDGVNHRFTGFPEASIGMFSASVEISTAHIGNRQLVFWLVDGEGYQSDKQIAEFAVWSDIRTGEWTQQLSDLPYSLNDVVWDGEVFIAVGGAGAVFTSSDGIDWVPRESSVDLNLNAVATYESSIVAVGESGTVILSQDHGESWSVQYGDELIEWHAVVIDASRIVVGGKKAGPDAFYFSASMASTDGGTFWEDASSLPSTGLWVISDIVSKDGLYIATIEGAWFYPNGTPQVWVSADARVWNAIDVGDNDRNAGLSAIMWDGNRFIVTGTGGGVFVSPDGYNWTQLTTPAIDARYLGIAGEGPEIIFAGGAEPWGSFCGPPEDVPAGLSSSDGLVSWEVFDIRTRYTSYGLARGPDRFVSVGALILYGDNCEATIEGQIYTTE